MAKSNSAFFEFYRSPFAKQWKLVKKLYQNHLGAPPSKSPRIPKTIHQIWIGGSLPEKYLPLQKTWIEKHPDWEYRLWTDADIPTFPFTDRARFEKAISIGEKADIFRYEILNAYGGLYVDTDFECVAPFDVFHPLCDFYVGLLGAYENGQEVDIGNALIGSIPHHPILEYCLKQIQEKCPATSADEVQATSGPGCLRRAFFKRCEKNSLRNVAFPFSFFYPLAPRDRCGHLDEMLKKEWIEPETYGIHYWDVSWAKEAE